MYFKIILIFCLLASTCFLFYKKNKEAKSQKPSNTVYLNQDKKVFDDYEEAIEYSKENNKKILVFFTAEWCGWCKEMKEKTIKDSEVENAIFQDKVICYIDMDKNIQLKNKFKINKIPAYLILNEKQEILEKSFGFKTKKEFLEWINPKKVSLLK
jgi:thioredoxin 1